MSKGGSRTRGVPTGGLGKRGDTTKRKSERPSEGGGRWIHGGDSEIGMQKGGRRSGGVHPSISIPGWLLGL